MQPKSQTWIKPNMFSLQDHFLFGSIAFCVGHVDPNLSPSFGEDGCSTWTADRPNGPGESRCSCCRPPLYTDDINAKKGPIAWTVLFSNSVGRCWEQNTTRIIKRSKHHSWEHFSSNHQKITHVTTRFHKICAVQPSSLIKLPHNKQPVVRMPEPHV